MNDRSYRKDPNIVSRKIVDEVILVPIKRKLPDVNAIYLLRDEVSERIWNLIDGKKSVDGIKKIICEEFKVEPEKAEKDLFEFLKQLEEIGGIEQVKKSE